MGTRYFIDTEFIERPGLLDLISIALVCDDGREFYAVSAEFNAANASEWVVANVLPKLPPRETWISRVEITSGLRAFIGPAPTFWGYFADYDWVLFCWLFGSMVELPDGWPMFCLDLKQSMVERGFTKDDLPAQPERAHDALEDARWLRQAWETVYGPKGSGA